MTPAYITRWFKTLLNAIYIICESGGLKGKFYMIVLALIINHL